MMDYENRELGYVIIRTEKTHQREYSEYVGKRKCHCMPYKITTKDAYKTERGANDKIQRMIQNDYELILFYEDAISDVEHLFIHGHIDEKRYGDNRDAFKSEIDRLKNTTYETRKVLVWAE